MAPAHTPTEAVESFRSLLTEEGQGLLETLRDHDPAQELALATRLRRDHPSALVSAAFAQAQLRRRAAAKFGQDAGRMYFTPDGVEQATRTSVAAHRAARFRALGVSALADLCCGIGGDAIALARAGIRVFAVDHSPLTCVIAQANAAALGLADRIEVRCADVGEVDVSGYDAVFIDPARRVASGAATGRAGGRVFDPEAYAPPLSWAVEVASRMSYGAVKTAPGIPHQAIPATAEAEWVSEHGEVKEAALWFGTGGGVRATLLPGGDSLPGRGLPDPGPGEVGRYLYEPDGAVIRAHLVSEVARQVGGRLIDPTIAYVTADALTATPYATAYELTDVLPFSLKRLRALLRERGVGVVTVKKRGSAVEPEELRKKLKLDGPRSCVVILTRVAGAPTVLLGHRCPPVG